MFESEESESEKSKSKRKLLDAMENGKREDGLVTDYGACETAEMILNLPCGKGSSLFACVLQPSVLLV